MADEIASDEEVILECEKVSAPYKLKEDQSKEVIAAGQLTVVGEE